MPLLSYGCLDTVNVLWLFLTVPLVGLRCVIVVFPDHTNLLFVQSTLAWFAKSPLRSFLLFMSCVCHAFASVYCCLVVTFWEWADLLFVMLNCNFVTFPCGILGQVWYLIVLIPGRCRLSFFCCMRLPSCTSAQPHSDQRLYYSL